MTWSRAGVLTERESWGVLYAISVSAVATATTAALTVGLALEHDLWPAMAEPAQARRRGRGGAAARHALPEASRFAREHFTLGDVAVQPGEQVLLWLTAANRGIPGEHRQPLDRFDPGPRHERAPGLGHRATTAAPGCTTPAPRPSPR